MASTGRDSVWVLKDLPPPQMIFGRSLKMQLLRQKIDKFAATNVPILIRGESGVGKDILARYFHLNSAVPAGPFVSINCAAIPGTLLESELFGYEPGAFTGAHVRKKGRAELASGGTLFLDGIDEIALSLQPKLLQILQEGQFTRIGGREEITVNTRIICASTRPLEAQIAAGQFRLDLYYRISVASVELPALRMRTEDILDLVQYFLDRYQKKHNIVARPISPGLIHMLQKHPWPGNIRELENLMERYVILRSEEAVRSELAKSATGHTVPDLPTEGPMQLKDIARQAVRALEGKVILQALQANHWNRKRTAAELRVSYRVLLQKIRKAGLLATLPSRRRSTAAGAEGTSRKR